MIWLRSHPCSRVIIDMFPLNARIALSAILGSNPWLLLGSVSFEPRWRGASDFLREIGLRPRSSCFLFPIDKGSRWERECRELQEKSWSEFVSGCDWSCERVEVDLLESPVWETAMKSLRELISQHIENGSKRLILDMSTMPKLCLYPVVKLALEMDEIEFLLILYTEPLTYFGGPLHSEPVGYADHSGL